MVAVAQMNTGCRAVEARDAAEAAKHVGDVRAEDAAVRVQLVDDHVAQLLERARPVRRGAGGCPACSMSGLVSTIALRSRAARRASPGVSPS